MCEVVGWADQCREQVLDLVAGHGDQAVGGGSVAAFGGCSAEEGVGEHGEGGPAVPGGPAADLVLVQAGQALACLELSSIVQRRPATRTSSDIGTGRGEKQR